MTGFGPRGLWLLCLLVVSVSVRGEPLRVAVAANFRATLQEIGREFTTHTATQLVISSAATGVLVQQILSGARFDVLFSADARHIDVLQERDMVRPETRISYAEGRLVLWAPHLGRAPQWADLKNPSLRIGIANPVVAPYGLAARQVLEHSGAWDPVSVRLVRAQSVANVVQLASRGLVDLALIGRPQLHRLRTRSRFDEVLDISPELHTALDQQAVVLRSASQSRAATALLGWVANDWSRAVIQRDGYALPANPRVN